MTDFSVEWNALRTHILLNCAPDVRDKLYAWLDQPAVQERWRATPASSALRYHHAYPGGLLCHLNDMAKLAQELLKVWPPIPPSAPAGTFKEELFLVILFHDFNKLGNALGDPEFVPNILKSGKQSEAEPFKHDDGALEKVASAVLGDYTKPLQQQAQEVLTESLEYIPDGIVSLSLVKVWLPELFARLTPVMKEAIIHHDGLYGKARGTLRGKETPLQLLLHFLDMWSSRNSK